MLLEVAAPARLTAHVPRGATEEGIENVAKATKALESVEGTASALCAAVHTSLSEPIVLSSFL